MDTCASDHIRKILPFLDCGDLVIFVSLNRRCKTLTLRDLPNRIVNKSITDLELVAFVLLTFIENPNPLELGLLTKLDDMPQRLCFLTS
jgi:hypothetical protein